MARMSEGKSKKAPLQRGDAPKAIKLPAQSKKNTRVLIEQNGSAPNLVSDELEPSKPSSLRSPQDHDGGQRGSVTDVRRPDDMYQDMNADGSNVSESDSAMHHRIKEHAFMLYQENGSQHGHDWADWFEAERQLTQGHRSSRDE
jgi:hypothetical protein